MRFRVEALGTEESRKTGAVRADISPLAGGETENHIYNPPPNGDLRMCLQVRGLAHPEHWQGPQGALFDRFGAVKASPLAAYKLLRQRESVLLFPGGGREVRPRLEAL